jgi:hypothetical protein
MAISNITTPRTISIDAMRPVLEGVRALFSLILTTRAGIFGPVAIVSDMRLSGADGNSAYRRNAGAQITIQADAFSRLSSSLAKEKKRLKR